MNRQTHEETKPHTQTHTVTHRQKRTDRETHKKDIIKKSSNKHVMTGHDKFVMQAQVDRHIHQHRHYPNTHTQKRYTDTKTNGTRREEKRQKVGKINGHHGGSGEINV